MTAPKDTPPPSSTGKVHGVKADQTLWRVKLQRSRIKFDDDQKELYLKELAGHGLKGRAGKVAGVSGQTVNNHIKNDPEFAELHEEAIQEYRDTIASEVRRRGQEGYLEPVYQKGERVLEIVYGEDGRPIEAEGRNGEMGPVFVPASVRKFSDRLLELEAKRVEPSYRDKQTIDINQRGGVLLAPAGMTPEDFIAEQEALNVERDKEHKAREAEAAKLLKGPGL